MNQWKEGKWIELTDEWIYKWMDVWMDRQMNVWMDILMNVIGQMDNESINTWMEEGLIDGTNHW